MAVREWTEGEKHVKEKKDPKASYSFPHASEDSEVLNY